MTCCVPKCKQTASVPLRAVDRNPKDASGFFWFCRGCGDYWASRGYHRAELPLGERA